jgi:hypothetical protein
MIDAISRVAPAVLGTMPRITHCKRPECFPHLLYLLFMANGRISIKYDKFLKADIVYLIVSSTHTSQCLPSLNQSSLVGASAATSNTQAPLSLHISPTATAGLAANSQVLHSSHLEPFHPPQSRGQLEKIP